MVKSRLLVSQTHIWVTLGGVPDPRVNHPAANNALEGLLRLLQGFYSKSETLLLNPLLRLRP